uniref:SDA1 C-terminal domain-containing protein n=1 Tax=Parascaris equorum TaxID=6256 RepID=A0A914REE8_PAREQ
MAVNVYVDVLQGAHVGRTNRELAKRKNYQMVRQKVRGKNRKRSFRDQQLSLKKYLLKQSGKRIAIIHPWGFEKLPKEKLGFVRASYTFIDGNRGNMDIRRCGIAHVNTT